jgi:hypothetical protein
LTLLGDFSLKNQQSQFYKNKAEANFSEKEKHSKLLKNFEKSSKGISLLKLYILK